MADALVFLVCLVDGALLLVLSIYLVSSDDNVKPNRVGTYRKLYDVLSACLDTCYCLHDKDPLMVASRLFVYQIWSVTF